MHKMLFCMTERKSLNSKVILNKMCKVHKIYCIVSYLQTRQPHLAVDILSCISFPGKVVVCFSYCVRVQRTLKPRVLFLWRGRHKCNSQYKCNIHVSLMKITNTYKHIFVDFSYNFLKTRNI